jgi:gamma-glutamyltranspeptidase/glutathione hydrolase
VPGCVDGWDQLLGRFGTKRLGELLAPSIEYADRGVATPPVIANSWHNAVDALRATPEAAATYLPNGDSPKQGEIFRNPRLGATYRLLASGGRDAFYRGEIAQKIVDYSKRAGGLFELRDFADHTSTWVDPVSTNYRGYDVWEIPPPGQGIAVLQILNLLEAYDLRSLGDASADWWHLFIEAKKLAYADRATFYCDPEFNHVPVDRLISKGYADERRKRIDMRRAMQDCPCGNPSNTIYLCVVDKNRNCVSLIQSNYEGFGSRHCAGELGFMLQNRGTSFALDENHANALRPHKRPFHTIIPSFVTKNGRPQFVFGMIGGDMQPQGQVQVLINHLDFGMDIQAAGDAPRMMHSGSATPTGKPAEGCGHVSAEAAIPQSILDDLASRGHNISHGDKNGGAYQGILLVGEMLQGASESRRDGRAVGY